MISVSLKEAVVSYNGRRALGPVSLETRQGETIILVGESGAGKSTLLRLMREQVMSRAAWLPQELGLVPSLSVFHNVYMGQLDKHSSLYNLINLILPKDREVARIKPLLETLGMQELLWMKVSDLSGGQKQRVAIARTLYQEASLLLADEPVSALDKKRAEQVMEILTSTYPTSVIALHDIELALKFGQRVIGIQSGNVVLDEPAGHLTKRDLLALYQPKGPR